MAATLLDVVPFTIFAFIYIFFINFFSTGKIKRNANSKFHRVHLNPSNIAPDEIYLDRSKHLDLLPSRRGNTQHKVPFRTSFPRITWDTVIALPFSGISSDFYVF